MNQPSGIDRLLWSDEIRQLPLRYSVAIERRDVDAMAALFSPNARFGAWGEGDAGVRALMGHTMADSIFAVIMVANHVIDFDSDERAHGEVWANCYAQNIPGQFIRQLIKYEDTYERVRGNWTFLRRRHRLWFGAAAESSPLDQEPANWPESQTGVGDVPLSDPQFTAWYESRHRT